MSNTKFYEKMDDLFLIIYLKKLGLDVKDVKILSSNPEKEYKHFCFKVKPEKSLVYKKAFGTFDNMKINFDIISKKDSEHFEYDRSWQVNMHRCCGNKYYNWHEDEIDNKLTELHQKLNSIKVGNTLKNANKAKALIKSIRKEIQDQESLRLIVCGKVRPFNVHNVM